MATRQVKKEKTARFLDRNREILDPIKDIKLWFVSIIIGLGVGLAMAGLRIALRQLEFWAFQVEDERLATATSGLPAANVIAVPLFGGALVALLLFIGSRWNDGQPYRMGGIQDVIYARRHIIDARATKVPAGQMRLSLKDTFMTAIMAVVSLGTGASAGREGPAVHVGASLSLVIADWLKLSPAQLRAMLGCGAAAAVASSFNAPIAGVLFAHEVILGRYRIRDIGPVAMASVIAAVITQLLFGNSPLFVSPDIISAPIEHLLAAPVMGVFAALFAIIVIRSLVSAPKVGLEIAKSLKVPYWALPPFAGLIIGLFALAFPQILGVGYEATSAALAGGYSPQFMLILAFAKLGATAICIGARFGGGVFSTSVVTGAMLGGTFGGLVALVTGDIGGAKVFFTIVGMGAVSGAVLGAPLSTTLIVFELTRSYETAAAVLVAVSLATVLVQAVEGGSIFEKQLKSTTKRPSK